MMMNHIKSTIAAAGAFFILATAMNTPAQAQSHLGRSKDFVVTLTEQNIRDFIREVGEISTGQRPDMMDEDVANYFMNHMTERGRFKSKMRYEIPNFPLQENEISLGRDEYISSIVAGRYMMEDYSADVQIQDLKISGNGKQATFTSIVTEKGRMPFPTDPQKPKELEVIPITGKTVCEQKLAVSYNNFIQMAQADCETAMNFDPFGGKPLVP